MIVVKFGEIRLGRLMGAVAKLSGQQFSVFQTGYHVARILKDLETEAKIVHGEFLKFLKQYAILDEKGAFVPISPEPQHKETFTIPDEKQAAWQEAAEKFHEETFTLDRYRILVSALEKETALKLTPLDLVALEPILTEIDEEKTPAKVVSLQ